MTGAITFLAAHLVEVRGWRAWFSGGANVDPWFLNSGRAVAFTAVALFAAAAVVAALGPSPRARAEPVIVGGNLAAGAVVSMAAVLTVTGAGTLFPIVLAIGGAILIVSSILGALVGSLARTPRP